MKLEELNLEGLKIDASQITHEKYKLIAIADSTIYIHTFLNLNKQIKIENCTIDDTYIVNIIEPSEFRTTNRQYLINSLNADKIIRYFGLKGKFLTADPSQNKVAHTNKIEYKIVPLTADNIIYER